MQPHPVGILGWRGGGVADIGAQHMGQHGESAARAVSVCSSAAAGGHQHDVAVFGGALAGGGALRVPADTARYTQRWGGRAERILSIAEVVRAGGGCSTVAVETASGHDPAGITVART